MREDDFFDELFKVADCVLEVNEIDHLFDKEYKEEVRKVAISHTNNFMKQFEKKLSCLEDEDNIGFLYETTFNFLMFAMARLMIKGNQPDEKLKIFIKMVENHLLRCLKVPQLGDF